MWSPPQGRTDAARPDRPRATIARLAASVMRTKGTTRCRASSGSPSRRASSTTSSGIRTSDRPTSTASPAAPRAVSSRT
ncbi:hypothetical protein [Streptomyces sp. NPDC058086]|uniref:hypothetical protein n=1 Tax=Streptomyces sp. NPDC058086 TaxID=3346334 RepID=UPI0036E119B7